jgi:putative ABC transport system permease protein
VGWLRFFRRAKWDAERARELESYLQIETDENIARGMPPQEARDTAHRKLGNTTRIREEIYRMNTAGFLDTLVRDALYALRTLRRNPTFTFAALLTLAIGIGANTAVFSVINSVLLKPLRYPEPDELVAVWHKAPGAPGLTDVSGDLRLSPSMYFTYAEQNRTFQSIGVWITGAATVTGQADPEQVRVLGVSDGALQALDVKPALGRWLTNADQTPGSAEVVMLSHGYWRRRLGGDRSAIGSSIVIDSRPREVVGVMPEGFRFVNADFDVILPMRFDRSRVILPGFGFQSVARLKAGVTITEASADVARMVPIWMTSWPAAPTVNPRIYESWRIAPALRPLKQDVIGNVGRVLWVVMGTVGIVMLIACANVANLLLVRAEARQHELAIRVALGAGRTRIMGGLLIESLLLGIAGGVLGLALAYAGLQFLLAAGPANLPRLTEISIDGRTLGFIVAVSLLSGMSFGLIPALKHARFARRPRPSERRPHIQPEPGTLSHAQSIGGDAGRTGGGAVGQFRTYDPHVSGAAPRRIGIHESGATSNHADLDSGVACCGTRARRTPSKRTFGKARCDIRCYVCGVRQCDAYGRICSVQLGCDPRRREGVFRYGNSAYAIIQECLARLLSDGGHAIDCRQGLYVDRFVRSPARCYGFGESGP